jgi:hypothetical protein
VYTPFVMQYDFWKTNEQTGDKKQKAKEYAE